MKLRRIEIVVMVALLSPMVLYAGVVQTFGDSTQSNTVSNPGVYTNSDTFDPKPEKVKVPKSKYRAVPTPNPRANPVEFGEFKGYETIGKIVDQLGGDFGYAVKEYLSVIGISQYENKGQVAAKNAGLESYFQRIYNKNPCIAEMAQNFYGDIAKKDQLWSGEETDRFFQDRNQSATISDNAGDQTYPQIKPGWVWDLALKHTGGDENLAMTLIGMCGHDDCCRNVYTTEDQGPAKDYYTRQKIRDVRRAIIRSRHDPAILPEGQTLIEQSNRDKIKQLRKGVKVLAYGGTNLCPSQDSLFYIPKSLSKDSDVSPEFKTEIAKGFDYKFDEKRNPKYYHIYGSAFTACKLIEGGMPPAIAKRAQMFAAWLYRSINFGNFNCIPKDRSSAKKDCAYIDDAKTLLGKWAIGGTEIFGVPIPNTNISPLPIKRIAQYASTDTAIGNAIYKFTKPEGWDQSRFQKASMEVNQILLDWEWTVTQHEKGADFAAKHCKKQPRPADPEILTCPTTKESQDATLVR